MDSNLHQYFMNAFQQQINQSTSAPEPIHPNYYIKRESFEDNVHNNEPNAEQHYVDFDDDDVLNEFFLSGAEPGDTIPDCILDDWLGLCEPY